MLCHIASPMLARGSVPRIHSNSLMQGFTDVQAPVIPARLYASNAGGEGNVITAFKPTSETLVLN